MLSFGRLWQLSCVCVCVGYVMEGHFWWVSATKYVERSVQRSKCWINVCEIADRNRQCCGRVEVQCVRNSGRVLLQQLLVPGFRDPLHDTLRGWLAGSTYRYRQWIRRLSRTGEMFGVASRMCMQRKSRAMGERDSLRRAWKQEAGSNQAGEAFWGVTTWQAPHSRQCRWARAQAAIWSQHQTAP